MDWALRIWFLLLLASLHWNPSTGVDHNLHCVNDYLLTINCSLSIVPSGVASDTSYWLVFVDINEKEAFECMLTNTDGDCFCSSKIYDLTPDDEEYYAWTFTDTDIFDIALCQNQNDGSKFCEPLPGKYTPSTNIKPLPPCCLAVDHNSSQHHFTWKGAEEYGPLTGLTKNLKYQLQYFETGDKHNVIPREINTENINFSVVDEHFTPAAEYAARVRCSPNQAVYQGQWSDWSGEVHWRMGSDVEDLPSQQFVSLLGMVSIALCVLMAFILLLCYAAVKKWRRADIPTPAPYFSSLNTDCQGDLEGWAITQDKTGDMLRVEETVQIDAVICCADIQERRPQSQHPSTESCTYRNLTDGSCDASPLGIPYAVKITAPGSSGESPTLGSQPGGPVEGDSGCWICSHTTLERTSPFYHNEYCTLSTVQRTNVVRPLGMTSL